MTKSDLELNNDLDQLTKDMGLSNLSLEEAENTDGGIIPLLLGAAAVVNIVIGSAAIGFGVAVAVNAEPKEASWLD